jgi:hypothetical protein
MTFRMSVMNSASYSSVPGSMSRKLLIVALIASCSGTLSSSAGSAIPAALNAESKNLFLELGVNFQGGACSAKHMVASTTFHRTPQRNLRIGKHFSQAGFLLLFSNIID